MTIIDGNHVLNVSKKKLSRTQQALLDAMQSGVTVFYMRYMGSFNPNPYYWRGDNGNRCTAAANALIARGIAVLSRRPSGSNVLTLKSTAKKEPT